MDQAIESGRSLSVRANWIKWIVLTLVSLVAGYAIILMYAQNETIFALLTLVIVASGVVVFAREDTYSHRYIYPGIAAMVIFIIFPLMYTVGIAFTNYSGTNQLTFERVQAQFLAKTYEQPNSSYAFELYQVSDNKVQLHFQKQDKHYSTSIFALDESAPIFLSNRADKVGEKAPLRFVIQNRNALRKLDIVSLEGHSLSMSGLREFAASTPLYELQSDNLTLVSLLDGERLKPNMEIGFYQAVNEQGEFIGREISPGFVVGNGWENFTRIFVDKGIQGPFVQIFIWTVIFAGLTVLFTLAVGLVLASVVQWEELKGKAIYRMLLILPYAVPAFISILIFKGLFNQSFGEINQLLEGLFNFKVNWFTDPYMAKTMILIVNTWLGYPYIMILCMGLLKSIPSDLYEASAIDGAGPIDNFFKITLPLMIKPLTPLLIASFAFNFNNFVLIQLLTNGAPDIIGSSTPAGHTDLLVSYTYRIAFEGGGGQDFGLASAIATLIFIVVGALALLNLRVSKKQQA
ncbi:maltose ABC transporter permease MalF [Psychromonas sp. psych-6C06]|uniref:maltose ABC transporter permease MalF n=1 Tax=Psychromonas sp. psych-6C06 TaxID=2058089 RepID=UPI000C34D82B|nr:maltose ABC transporter permease MalF [Psychromonas sp. psych-6C06]PKF61948.1 maltose ABC transporter permease MalF [Psychromonas sp. psych-6C06]